MYSLNKTLKRSYFCTWNQNWYNNDDWEEIFICTTVSRKGWIPISELHTEAGWSTFPQPCKVNWNRLSILFSFGTGNGLSSYEFQLGFHSRHLSFERCVEKFDTIEIVLDSNETVFSIEQIALHSNKKVFSIEQIALHNVMEIILCQTYCKGNPNQLPPSKVHGCSYQHQGE